MLYMTNVLIYWIWVAVGSTESIPIIEGMRDSIEGIRDSQPEEPKT